MSVKWTRLDCDPRFRVSRGRKIKHYCWAKEGDTSHWEHPACANGCEAPAEYDSPDNLCEACWKAWFTREWEN